MASDTDGTDPPPVAALGGVCCAVYEKVAAVENLQSLPRLYQNRQVASLFSSDPELRRQYAWGVVAIPVILLATLLVWTLVLIVFPCMGPKRVGFLSGSRLRVVDDDGAGNVRAPEAAAVCKVPPKETGAPGEEGAPPGEEEVAPTEEKELARLPLPPQTYPSGDEEKNVGNPPQSPPWSILRHDGHCCETFRTCCRSSDGKQKGRPERVRAAFVFFAVACIVGAVAVGPVGVNHVRMTTHAAFLAAEDIEQIAAAGLSTIDEIFHQYTDVRNASEHVIFDLAEFCPESPPINRQAKKLADALEPVRIFSQKLEEASMVSTILEGVRGGSVTAQRIILQAEGYIFVALIYRVLVIALSCGFIMGTLMAWKEKSPRWLERGMRLVCLTLFTFLVGIAWILGCAIVVVGIVNADACAQDPSETIVAVLTNLKFRESLVRLVVGMAEYYFGCNHVPPRLPVVDLRVTVHRAAAISKSILNEIRKSRMLAISECGDDAEELTQSFLTLVEAVIRMLLTLYHSIADFVAIMTCARVTPIYQLLVNETVCIHNIRGMSGIFFSLVGIGVSGMVMIMLRSSLLCAEHVEVAATDQEEEPKIGPAPTFDSLASISDLSEAYDKEAHGPATSSSPINHSKQQGEPMVCEKHEITVDDSCQEEEIGKASSCHKVDLDFGNSWRGGMEKENPPRAIAADPFLFDALKQMWRKRRDKARACIHS